jgi:hypothetical protein
MTPKRGSLFGALITVAVVLGLALLLVPSFASGVGRLVANLWVTVMGAVVGILGAFMGR